MVSAAREFGGFRLDLARRCLETSDGQRISLTAKAFDTLACLLDHAGEPVSRGTLMRELWPGRVVEDNNLTQTISVLRRVLGDGYIVTLPGRGYQLVTLARQGNLSVDVHWLESDEGRLALSAGENLIGRDTQADVRLDVATVSRRHARIVISAEGATLEDLSSKNGTRVDGVRLQGRTLLRDGQRIALGTLHLTYRASGSRTATMAQAPADQQA